MFITFEGLDGSGKTTIIKKLSKYLNEHDKANIIVREPGQGKVGSLIRHIIMDYDIQDETEFLLFQAARAETVKNTIIPALADNVVVLSDRFIHSTYAYQGGGKGIPKNIIDQIHDFVLQNIYPDIVFYIDITPEESDKRSQIDDVNKFDKESYKFKRDVQDMYDKMSNEFYVINGMQSIEDVYDDILKIIHKYINIKKDTDN